MADCSKPPYFATEWFDMTEILVAIFVFWLLFNHPIILILLLIIIGFQNDRT